MLGFILHIIKSQWCRATLYSVNCCDFYWSIGRLRNCCSVWIDDGLWGCISPWLCLWCSTLRLYGWDLLSHVKPVQQLNCKYFNKVCDHFLSGICRGLLLPHSNVDLCGCCGSKDSNMKCYRWCDYLAHEVILCNSLCLMFYYSFHWIKCLLRANYICGSSFLYIQFCSMCQNWKGSLHPRGGVSVFSWICLNAQTLYQLISFLCSIESFLIIQ